MARNRDNQNDRDRYGRAGGRDMDRYSDTPRNLEDEDRPSYETAIRAVSIVDELLSMTSPSDSKYQYLLLLRHQLETDERQMQDAAKVIAEYEEAYNKLTSPANRIATFLDDIEGENVVHIALGDQEFIANVDPKLD